ncbi:MAG: hypothetical protein NZX77_17120 [Polyangiaceae bacterium]|nr:hypothetical protein [Polyangiaceae bacterium]
MPDPRGKFPGADFGSIDVDSLLSDLERKENPPAEKSPLPASPRASGKESGKAGPPPLYKPPAQTPTPPPGDYDDAEEERTVVGVISRDLIEEAARGAGGLGQLFGKPESSRRPVEPEGIDIVFDESGKHRVAEPVDDDVVMTSAPALEVTDLSFHDRITPVPVSPATPSAHDNPLDLGVLTDFPDPFAPTAKADPPKPSPKVVPPKPASKAVPPPLSPLSPPRQEQPTLPVANLEQDEPTRIGQVLSGDLDFAALRTQFAGTSVELPPPPGSSSAETTPIPASSPPGEIAPVPTPPPTSASPKPAAHLAAPPHPPPCGKALSSASSRR